MRPVPERKTDYARIAPTYDGRYSDVRYAGLRYAGLEARLRAFAAGARRLLEVGCGTGHWVRLVRDEGLDGRGLEPSRDMIARAREAVGAGALVRGRAEALPWAEASFDRVFSINAIHHYDDGAGFVREAARVLAPGGALMVVSMDPSLGPDLWFVYDWFEETLPLDQARYPAHARIGEWMTAAGLGGVETSEANHFRFEVPARAALEEGRLAQSVTSQLAILSEAE